MDVKKLMQIRAKMKRKVGFIDTAPLSADDVLELIDAILPLTAKLVMDCPGCGGTVHGDAAGCMICGRCGLAPMEAYHRKQ